jgi:hypothetical protein
MCNHHGHGIHRILDSEIHTQNVRFRMGTFVHDKVQPTEAFVQSVFFSLVYSN